MGNQVVVSFLTDNWHEIKKHPKKLVAAIDVGMTHGTESLSGEVFDQKHDFPIADYDEIRWAQRNYVTVHRFHHADEPQVTFTQHNSSWDVSDFAHAISIGLLDLKRNPKMWLKIARGIVSQLRFQADYLERVVREYEFAHPDEGG